jgi:hypothetical protein
LQHGALVVVLNRAPTAAVLIVAAPVPDPAPVATKVVPTLLLAAPMAVKLVFPVLEMV